MAYQIPPLNAVRAFEAAARHMSFQYAAAELNVSPSALSYQIRQLEEHLQVKLFKRLNRAIELTQEGARAAPLVNDGFERLNEAFRQVRNEEDERRLVVSSGPAFSAKWMAPRLHDFIELYPDVDFRLSASLKLTDFEADEVDAAIRFGGGGYNGLYVEPLFPEVILPCISPGRFEMAGGVADERLFEQVRLLHDDSANFLKGEVSWEHWFRHKGYDGVNADHGTRFNHADHGIDAAVDGAGIVFARLALAFRDLEAGRLIAPFDLAMRTSAGFYLCLPEYKMERESVMRFIAWLRDEAQDQSDAMEQFLSDKRVI